MPGGLRAPSRPLKQKFSNLPSFVWNSSVLSPASFSAFRIAEINFEYSTFMLSFLCMCCGLIYDNY